MKSRCVDCKFHHIMESSEDGWYCGSYHKWNCSKSNIYRDFSQMRVALISLGDKKPSPNKRRVATVWRKRKHTAAPVR